MRPHHRVPSSSQPIIAQASSSRPARNPLENLSERDTANRAQEDSSPSTSAPSLSRRGLFLTASTLPVVLPSVLRPAIATAEEETAAAAELIFDPTVDFSGPGPCIPARLPRVEHTAVSAFPRCLGNQCILRCDIWYPKGAERQGLQLPYPLAIISSGFLIPSANYESYAQRLASWGYVVILYDKLETINATIDDVTSVQFIMDLIDWCAQDRLLGRLCDTERVFLIGHSRGAKISTLAASSDPRVRALFLIDPVDNTKYAPLGEGFPSACEALSQAAKLRGGEPLPVAVVGAGIGGDCVPPDSNYAKYYKAAEMGWLLVVRDTGHFDFIDERSSLLSSICASGDKDPTVIRECAQTAMIAWGEAYCRPRVDSPEELEALRLARMQDKIALMSAAFSSRRAASQAAEEGADREAQDQAQQQEDPSSSDSAAQWPRVTEPKIIVKLATLRIARELGVEDSEVRWGNSQQLKEKKKRKERPPLESIYKNVIPLFPAERPGGADAQTPTPTPSGPIALSANSKPQI